jgi:hypothetical protein
LGGLLPNYDLLLFPNWIHKVAAGLRHARVMMPSLPLRQSINLPE